MRKTSVILRQRQASDGKQSLYLDMYVEGRRRYESLKLYLTGDRKRDKEIIRLAETIRKKREAELLSDGLPTNTSELFLDSYRRRWENMSYNTLKSYKAAIKMMAAITNIYSLKVTDISQELLERYSNHLQQSHLTAATAWLYLSKIKCWCRWAKRNGTIRRDPSENIDNIRHDTKRRLFLTEDELRTLIEHTDPDNVYERMFIFACFTGLRLIDMANLNYSDIDGDQIVLRQQKTSEYVYIPLSEDARNIISPFAAGRVFSGGRKIYDFTANQNIRQWCKRAGITKQVTMHTARHTFAVLLLTKGVDIYTVRRLLGHTSLATTQIYADIVDERRRQAIQQLPKLL